MESEAQFKRPAKNNPKSSYDSPQPKSNSNGKHKMTSQASSAKKHAAQINDFQVEVQSS